MKTIRNILAALLLVLLIWANAQAESMPIQPNITGIDFRSTTELKADIYVSNTILHVQFETAQDDKLHIEVFDITGKRIKNVWLEKKETLHREVELNDHLKSGVYIVKISKGKDVSTQKLRI